MSSPSDISKCIASSSSSGDREAVAEISSNKKVSTSCEQKVEHWNGNDDSASCANNLSSGNDNDDSSTVSDILSEIRMEYMAISDDKELFKDLPPKEDCPICMLPMPLSSIDEHYSFGTIYMPCCGKLICKACSMAEDEEMERGTIKAWCSLCRVPIHSSDEEYIERCEHRMKLKDAEAFYYLGCSYNDGDMGLTKDRSKALDLWKRSAELGSIRAHARVALAYYNESLSRTGEYNMKKARYHFELAAIGGHEESRYNLGVLEGRRRKFDLAQKHYKIAATCGFDKALKKVGEGYKKGYVTKEDYASTLRAYQLSMDEMKSEQRTIASSDRN